MTDQVTNTTDNTNNTDSLAGTDNSQGQQSSTALGKTDASATDLQIFQSEMIIIQTKMSISNSYFNSMLAIMDKASKSSLR